MKIKIELGNLLVSKALQLLLSKENEKYQITIAAELQEGDTFCPDFVITDMHTLQNYPDGMDPNAKVLLLDHGMSEEEMSALLISCKIDGVLTAESDVDLFNKALQAVSNGQIWIDNCKIKALVRYADTSKAICNDSELTIKEREIALLVSQGLMNKEIASMLYISVQTVKTHISNIFRKLNISRRTQLLPLVMKLGLTDN